MANCHLVILKRPYLDAILSGKKKIESRFLKSRKYFLEHLKAGDILFLKQSSGPVCASAKVANVKLFEKLTAEKILEIKKQFNNLICGDEKFWQSVMACRFASLVWLADVKRIKPVWINKRDWRAWVVLTENENFGLFELHQTASYRPK
jgi:ASC-1-like (ASCH) protein